MDKNKEFGLSPEIAKLSEKLTKDPSSKLFVPLAEEYRKIGMLDEAIQVLTDGLKENPNYMTARVSLGKMLLEKGNISEAQKEFEKVVQAIPDNLFAHKKLAEIFQSKGDTENLLKEYRTILSLSPKDEDIRNALNELESKPGPSSVESFEERLESHRYEIRPEISEPTLREKEEERTEEVDTTEIFSLIPEEIPVKEQEVDKVIELTEETPEEAPIVEPEVLEEKVDVVYELSEETLNPEELGIEILPKMTPVDEGPHSKEMDKFHVPEIINRGMASIKEPPEEELSTETMAEIYIKQGLYEKAAEIYQQILNSDPENLTILQKREELLSLINLMKQKDSGNTVRINKLEAWLKNIKERRR